MKRTMKLLIICLAVIAQGQEVKTIQISGAVQLSDQILQVPQFSDRNTLSAFYYLWYDNPDRWEFRHHNDEPMLGKYFSTNLHIAEQHIRLAKWAGIDEFICSWWGPGSYEDERFAEMLDIAEQLNFKVSILLETLASGNIARPDNVLRGWLDYAVKQYGQHPAMVQVDGEPLICIWASPAVPTERWEQIFAGLPAKFLSMKADVNDLAVFDGEFQYMAHKIENPEHNLAYRQRSVQFYAYQNDTPKIYAAPVSPGCSRDDDQKNKVERDGGRVYEMFWDAAITSGATRIFITSWNEWPEATYIEPSMEYGMLYLQLTKEFAEQWKK